jgi:integrase
VKGHIRKRGPNTYTLVVELGMDATGKRRQKWHTVHGNKKDAEAELARILHEINTGMYAEPNRLLVRDYLEQWLEEKRKSVESPKTYERYAEICRLHLIPALGHLRLADLRSKHVQDLEDEMLSNGRKDGREGGLSARTVLHHHRVLRSALQQAVSRRIIHHNPTDNVKAPKPLTAEVKVLDEGQTMQLLAALRETRLYLPAFLAATTGLRRGEILALRWADVDLKTARLTVNRSLGQTRQGGLRFGPPKSEKGLRTIALPAMTVEALERHHAKQSAERLRLGPLFEDNDLVAPRRDGRPQNPMNFTTWFSRRAKTAGYPCHFHSLRHGHATQLFSQGVPAKVVQERLGHSTIAITLNIYTHVPEAMDKEAAAKIDAALSSAAQQIAS